MSNRSAKALALAGVLLALVLLLVQQPQQHQVKAQGGLPSANQVFAGPPSGPPAFGAWRALVPADVPCGSGPTPPGGRLTLVAGVPVFATDQVAMPNIYYSPSISQTVPIWNGNCYAQATFTSSPTDTVGQTLALAGGIYAAQSVYDLFIGFNGSNVLTLCSGPVWTNGGLRSAAGSVGIWNGLPVNNNASPMLCRYGGGSFFSFTCAQYFCLNVGTFITDPTISNAITFQFGSTAVNFGQANLSLWNNFNRVVVQGSVSDSTGNWNSNTSGTFFLAHSSATARVNLIRGNGADAIVATYRAIVQPPQVVGQYALAGVGINGATTPCGPTGYGGVPQQSSPAMALVTLSIEITASCGFTPGLGFNVISAMEFTSSSTNAEWFGTLGSIKSGLSYITTF